MKKQKPRCDGQETRKKLLAAAGELFAQKGFWETTNADICKKADVNIASVNYYFNSKDNLYIEAWKYSFEKSIKKYPPDGGVPSDASPSQRLYGSILSILERTADPQTHDIEIVHKEMANPTGLLTEMIEKAVEQLDLSLREILKELLGAKVTEQQIKFCHMSIMGQCFGPMLHLRHSKAEDSLPHPKHFPPDLDIENLAKHITQFSMVGINGIREGK